MALKIPIVLDTNNGIGALQNGDSIASSLVIKDYIASVALAVDKVVALDTAGHVKLCSATLDTSTSYNKIGIVVVAAASGGIVKVATNGEVTLSTNYFTNLDINKTVFMSTLIAGAFSTTVPTGTGVCYVPIGIVSALNKLILSAPNSVAYPLK